MGKKAKKAAKRSKKREKDELDDMSVEELRARLRKRKARDRVFEIKEGKKEGVVVIWPSTRSRFPLSAQAETWAEIVEHVDDITEYLEENHPDSLSQS